MFPFYLQHFLLSSIRALIEAGLVDQWLREVIAVTPQCLKPPTADRTDGVSPIDLKSFSGPLLVLVAGEWWETRKSNGESFVLHAFYLQGTLGLFNNPIVFLKIIFCFRGGRAAEFTYVVETSGK